MTQAEKNRKRDLFMQDVVAAMTKHGITDMVCIYGLADQIRNTYLPLNGEVKLYCDISDAFNEWLSQGKKNHNYPASIFTGAFLCNNPCKIVHARKCTAVKTGIYPHFFNDFFYPDAGAFFEGFALAARSQPT